MIKSKKNKRNTSKYNTKKRGGSVYQTMGRTQHESKILGASIGEDINLDNLLTNPATIRSYLLSPLQGTKEGASAFVKVKNRLLAIRKKNINDMSNIINLLQNQDDTKVASRALDLIEKLHGETTESRYHMIIYTKNTEIPNQLTRVPYTYKKKAQESDKDRIINTRLGRLVHQLRSSIADALGILIKNENNELYIFLGTVIKEGRKKIPIRTDT